MWEKFLCHGDFTFTDPASGGGAGICQKRANNAGTYDPR